jgi:salicylate hydroxylase
VASSRNIVIAGAGIGGLTAALALAAEGYRVTFFEQSTKLEETGAGIQLSPNATRILIDLGVGQLLDRVVVAPEALDVRSAHNGRYIVEMPLNPTAQMRYGAPYWMVHRADLQAGLLAAVEAHPDITITLGAKVEDYAVHRHGLTIQARQGQDFIEDHAIALIGADGVWSTIRGRLGLRTDPQFRKRTAWRSLVPAEDVPVEYRDPFVQLWLGHDAHLVHYPVCGGQAINIVAIARDTNEEAGWNGQGSQEELLSRFSLWNWCGEARDLLKIPANWSTWRLYDMAPLRYWSKGPVTLLGDAAHPMLPFLAQGAGMAIEDAVVLAGCLARTPDDVPAAFQSYEDARRTRVTKVQKAARRNGDIYHKAGIEAFVRNTGMRMIGGRGLLGRYSWIYRWRAPRTTKTAVGGPRLRNEVALTPEDEEATMPAASSKPGNPR